MEVPHTQDRGVAVPVDVVAIRPTIREMEGQILGQISRMLNFFTQAIVAVDVDNPPLI